MLAGKYLDYWCNVRWDRRLIVFELRKDAAIIPLTVKLLFLLVYVGLLSRLLYCSISTLFVLVILRIYIRFNISSGRGGDWFGARLPNGKQKDLVAFVWGPNEVAYKFGELVGTLRLQYGLIYDLDKLNDLLLDLSDKQRLLSYLCSLDAVLVRCVDYECFI